MIRSFDKEVIETKIIEGLRGEERIIDLRDTKTAVSPLLVDLRRFRTPMRSSPSSFAYLQGSQTRNPQCANGYF